MKYIFSLFVLCFCLLPVQAEERILLPFGVQGVPYYEGPEADYMDGFAIDGQGNLYFTGGGAEHPVLFCYSQKERKTLYRVSLPDATSGALCYTDGKLYLLEQWRKGATHDLTLTQINPSNGKILSQKKLNCPDGFSNSIFTDNQISVKSYRATKINGKGEATGVAFKYCLYDLQGEITKRQMDAPYDLDDKVLSSFADGSSTQYVGRYQNGYVFYDACPENQYDWSVFVWVDGQGRKIKQSKALYKKDIGGPMMSSSEGNPEEHKKIAGDFLYLLGEKDNALCVNKYSLKELFAD